MKKQKERNYTEETNYIPCCCPRNKSFHYILASQKYHITYSQFKNLINKTNNEKEDLHKLSEVSSS